ncbi:hypothetical protein EGM97_11315 [Pseudomonas sp. AF32]|nr:hypothetical protein [Pseudomonas sp. AF32]
MICCAVCRKCRRRRSASTSSAIAKAECHAIFPVGASLLAIAECQATYPSSDTPLSRAGSLPQV